jgi:hypothetical protein
MVKAFIKYLLLVCILLASGVSHLSAHKIKESTSYAATGSEHASLGILQADQVFTNKSSSSDTEKNFIIEIAEIEIEEEDDEWISFKKHVESSHYLTTLFYAYLPEYFYLRTKNCLAFYKRFSHRSTPESLYLIFRVFRL